MNRTSSEKIADALFDALLTADQAALKVLVEEIRTWETKYSWSARDVRRQPFAGKMLEAILASCDALEERRR